MMPNKLIIDNTTHRALLNDMSLDFIREVTISPKCDGYSYSKVTITLDADVTLIPPDRDKHEAEVQARIAYENARLKFMGR